MFISLRTKTNVFSPQNYLSLTIFIKLLEEQFIQQTIHIAIFFSFFKHMSKASF